jgi:hypothetical protein
VQFNYGTYQCRHGTETCCQHYPDAYADAKRLHLKRGPQILFCCDIRHDELLRSFRVGLGLFLRYAAIAKKTRIPKSIEYSHRGSYMVRS